MFGLLNINKPTGVTSRDIVNRVQRLVRPAKIGHTGTLDPLANGVLVLCVGPATRLAAYVQRMRKQYRATFLLGSESDTEDTEGTVVALENAPRIDIRQIEDVLPSFCGTILQRPPAYSALKVAGQRAYSLARAGISVELSSREVVVYELRLVSLNYPEMVLDIQCGGGTYVRSLGRDIALKLKTAAVMSALTRVGVGSFHVDTAIDVETLTPESLPASLLPPRMALEGLPVVCCSEAEVGQLRHGQLIESTKASDLSIGQELAAIDSTGMLVAIVQRAAENQLAPNCVFSQ